MKKEVKFLGIDIGGAHIKLIGLNKKKSVCFANYRKLSLLSGLSKWQLIHSGYSVMEGQK